MKDPTNIVEVAGLSPDWMGFIFYKNSPRYVGDDFVMPKIPHLINKVGVFVNETTPIILQLIEKHKLDLIQLHGDESVDQLVELKRYGVKVMKAFRVDGEFDFQVTEAFQSDSDCFLFDTKGKNYGGNNITFDWGLLKKYNQQIPFLLSGGLNVQNLVDTSVLKDMNCVGYDFNSGVEESVGVKNLELVRDVMRMSDLKNEISKIKY